jgi:hypothetical protein
LRAQLDEDIAELMTQAEAADAADAPDAQALPKEIARRAALRDKLDAACARLEAEAAARAEEERPAWEEKKRAHEARGGRGRAPKEPDATPPPDAQSNLTDADSALMRKSKRHEYRQAYNAQAVVDADASQLVLASGVSRNASDAPSFAETIDRLCAEVGQPTTVLGDGGYANGEAVARLEARGIEVLVAVSRPEGERLYDFRPPRQDTRPPPEPKAEWRKAMKAKLETEDARAK